MEIIATSFSQNEVEQQWKQCFADQRLTVLVIKSFYFLLPVYPDFALSPYLLISDTKYVPMGSRPVVKNHLITTWYLNKALRSNDKVLRGLTSEDGGYALDVCSAKDDCLQNRTMIATCTHGWLPPAQKKDSSPKLKMTASKMTASQSGRWRPPVPEYDCHPYLTMMASLLW